MNTQVNIRNKKAGFEYFLLDEFVAGIVLTGTEIKSIRAGKASINDAYCTLINGEVFVVNMHVAEYENGSYNNHQPKRDRKLLLQKKEIRKITTKIKERGFTLIPVLLYIDENGRAKLKIAIAKGKKMYDKRETLKSKDLRRDFERHEKY